MFSFLQKKKETLSPQNCHEEVMSTASEMSELLAASFSAVFVAETRQNVQAHQRFGGMLEETILSPVAVAGGFAKAGLFISSRS